MRRRRRRTRRRSRSTPRTRWPASSWRRTALASREQRVEDVARSVRVGEQLAVRLLVQRDADLAEERDRSLDRKARSTRRTIARRPPQKSRSVTTVLVTLHREPPLTRIFAPGCRAPSRRTTRKRRSRAAREDGGGHPGRAGADDRDIAGRRKAQPANKVLCRVRLGRDDGRVGAAGVAADDQRFPIFETADDLGAMTAALRAELRRLGLLFGMSVVNHNVICSRNAIAKALSLPGSAVTTRYGVRSGIFRRGSKSPEAAKVF